MGASPRDPVRWEAGPLVALGGLVAGVFAGEHLGVPASGVAFAAGGCGLGAAWFSTGKSRVALATLALALVGAAAMSRALDGVQRGPLDGAVVARARVTLPATITSDPAGGRFTATALARVDTGRGTHRTVLVVAGSTTVSRLRALEAGDEVRLAGRLAPLRERDGYLRGRHAIARLEDADVVELAPPRVVFAVANVCRAFVLRGMRPLPQEPRALLAGFLLGDTRGIPPRIEDAYRDSGLSHLLAVSGSNVAFVLALAGPLLRRLTLGARTLAACAVVVVFASMTRFEPSVLRASAMAAIVLLASLAGRGATRLRVLAYAVIVLLVADPFLVHSVGFRLSCGACAGIAVAQGPIARRLPGPRALREPLAVSISAQLGVMPVLLGAFGAFPAVTPLANLAAAPAAEVLGVYGFLASIVAAAVPALGPLVHQPTAACIAWVTGTARAGAAVPLRLDARALLFAVATAAAIASLACGRAGLRTPARRAVPDRPPR